MTRAPLRFRHMPELPPEIATESEPTDSDPPPEAIRTDRPRIWPQEPRAPRPQIKRPMEEWLVEFEERVKQQDAHPREQPPRRRRPRGLARIVPAAPPPRPERARTEGARPQPSEAQPRGRRRRRGGGRPQAQAGEASSGPAQTQPRPPRQSGMTGRRRGRDRSLSSRGTMPPARPSPPKGEGEFPGRPPRGQGGSPPESLPRGEGDFPRRRRRRGRGRGRGPRPGGPQNPGGTPNPGGGPGPN